MNRTLSIWNELRPYSVGFDNIFDHFSNTLEFTHSQNQSYPPYNINKVDDLNWQIEMALAGFSKNDIEVSYADNQLTIKSALYVIGVRSIEAEPMVSPIFKLERLK